MFSQFIVLLLINRFQPNKAVAICVGDHLRSIRNQVLKRDFAARGRTRRTSRPLKTQ